MKCSKKTKRLFSVLLMLAMCFTLLQGMTAFAAVNGNAYFLSGTIAGWGLNANYELTEVKTGLYKIEGVALTASTLIKVVKSNNNGTVIGSWYPNGMDNNQTVSESGNYTVFFRPSGDGTAEEGYTYIPYEGDNSGLDAHGCTNGGYMFKFVKEAPPADYYDGELGALYSPEQTTFKLWKPTASEATLNIYTEDTGGTAQSCSMTKLMDGDKWTGVWTYTISGDVKNQYYTYEIGGSEQLDPYAYAINSDGTRSVIVDLDSTNPAEWDNDVHRFKDTGENYGIVQKLSAWNAYDEKEANTNTVILPVTGKPNVPSQSPETVGQFKSLVKSFHDMGITVLVSLDFSDTGFVSDMQDRYISEIGVRWLNEYHVDGIVLSSSIPDSAKTTLRDRIDEIDSRAYLGAEEEIPKAASYNLWVGGVQVTAANVENVLAGDAVNDGKVSYDADKKTLTLSGANIEAGYQIGNQKAAVYTTEDLILEGSGSMGGDGIGYGLYTKGEKSLTLNGDFSFAGTVNGIYTFGGNNMLVEGGNVTATGGTNGIFASSNSSITVNGGNMTVTGHGKPNAYGYGIQAKNLTVNGGSLTATGGTGGSLGNGIAADVLTVSGGIVTAIGNNGALDKAPTLGSNITAVASANMDGTGYVSYNASQNNSYKWFRTTEAYNLYVGGTQVTSLNSSNVLGDGKVSYDADTNTLTLDGADISNGTQKYKYRSERYYTDLIYANNIGDLTVKVVSDSTLHRTQTDSWTSPRGIALYDDSGATLTVELQNGATLNMPITTTAQQAYYVTAFALSGYDLTVKGNGNLNIDLSASDSSTASAGIKILDNIAHTFSIEDSVNVDIRSNHSLMLNAAGIQSNESKLSLSVGENANLTVKACTGLSNVNATVNGTMDISPIKSALDYNILRALSGSSVTAGEGKAVYAGKNAENAVKQTSPWTGFSGATENNCYVAVKAPVSYTVTVTPGANMTKSSGEESQTVGEGEAITDVVYTADTGCFPDTYSVEAVNGISVTRNSATQITVSGTPTAAANITLTAPSAHQGDDPVQENVSSATCTAGGSYDNVTYCKFCGVELSRAPVYTDPLGHDYIPAVTNPTCTENGYTTYTCRRCTDSYVGDYINALGHNFGTPAYEWTADNTSVTGTRTCARDASHIDTETVTTTSEITKSATLTEPGEHTYTATFTKTGFTTQTKTVADIPVLVSSFTVTFNANGGTVTPASDETGTDGKITSLPIPTRSGYRFNGWFTAESSGTQITDETVFDADAEIFAQWTKKISSSVSSAPVTYSVTPVETDNGSVAISPKNASKGSTVKIIVTPDKGYKLDKLTVTEKDGKAIELIEKDGVYTFKMPAGKVDVMPVFVKENIEPTATPTPDPTIPPADSGNPFTDVAKGDYFYNAVLWAAKEKITSGTSATTFSPNDSCTRAQTVTFLWRTEGSPEPITDVNPFTDVKTGDYFYKAVLWAYENGITQGTSDKEFSPNATVTRGQTVTFLHRLTGDKANGKNPFTDVKTGDYFYDAVLWAAEENITSGTSATTFSPDDDCLRGQIVAFLYRCKNK